MKKTLIIGTLFSVLCLSNAFALDKPQAAKEDQRVLYTDFRADEVYPVTAASGIITTIVFSPSEQVQSYGSGFSTAWEFLSRGNYFFLKPKQRMEEPILWLSPIAEAISLTFVSVPGQRPPIV